MLTIEKLRIRNEIKYKLYKDDELIFVFCSLWEKVFSDRKSLILQEGEKKNITIKGENPFLIAEAKRVKTITEDVEIVEFVEKPHCYASWMPLSVWNKGVSEEFKLKIGEKKEVALDTV